MRLVPTHFQSLPHLDLIPHGLVSRANHDLRAAAFRLLYGDLYFTVPARIKRVAFCLGWICGEGDCGWDALDKHGAVPPRHAIAESDVLARRLLDDRILVFRKSGGRKENMSRASGFAKSGGLTRDELNRGPV